MGRQMSDSNDKFEKRFQESRLQYIKGLPGKIADINLIWNQLQNNEWRLEVVLKMRNMAHNLSGSGGTFGFHELSEQARELENALDMIKINSDNTPDEESITKINDLLVKLQEVGLHTIQVYPSIPESLTKTNLIYILDTDREASLGMSRQLLYFGCNVKLVTDISSLAANMQNATPILIIIDSEFASLMLEKYNVIQTIRKEWHISCPVIYVSHSHRFEDRLTAMKEGASAYFNKPIDISLLLERINILTNAHVVEPYRILLVEDDVQLANFYSILLERGGLKVFIESAPEQVINRIIDVNPELVVMDLYMPKYNGIELIKVIRQHQSLFTLPIVLLTSEKDINVQFLAREVGVDDFLNKPITEKHLFDSVLNRVQRSRYANISITKDSLTGLFVHKKINEYLADQLHLSKRYNTPLSYIIIDLDNFKNINETYGHLTGDSVIITLSNFLKTSVRVTDFVGRYGGEQFVIICPETTAKAALNIIERLRKHFAAINHYHDNQTFRVTFSAGIASFPKYQDIDIMMAEADKALYKSKDNGRNQSTIA
jgi:diguanylate cyclase (GGDEF)-like protein